MTAPTLVIIPTYNESENLERIVARLHEHNPDVHVLVADDNSPDGTGEIADKLAAADDRIQVLHRKGKEGLGAAYLAGFRWGLDAGYQVLVEMDADGSHRPEDLPRLLAALDERQADLVLGSRWVKGGRVVNWPKTREFLSRGGNLYVRLATGMRLRDATGGFRVFRRTTLEGLGLDGVESAGYCFQVDMARRALRAGFHVVEVPITFVEREFGVSKMSGNIVTEALWRSTVWGFQDRTAKLTRRGAKR
ncbi:polyprenol monophosphomannose synthase [Actinocrinis puniceicyclus]|uniref:Polyprenol monophosphomannose synthase n=1 Tax=Actinocrinis puniceicyclus TaxID=977794 RepID=A0A8J8BAI7_9ACTN|nr:polyprenol monophosphomannose synthase [Actinocrinis puniceicyclus]MBS2963007.1 polyprenol monophosphomannose synthase [Actinocrinis puniceicyclus]